ncbi:MAG TPA: hypothetical protein VN829_09395 [Dongiaceae bacterium]|nr:hypothetical protein [Dongiaceae bacterium]
MTGPRRPTQKALVGIAKFAVDSAMEAQFTLENDRAQLGFEAAANAELRERLTAASLDAPRIEWLGAHCPSINRTARGVQVKWWAHGHIHGAEGDNLREAVDKAMKR